MSIRKRKDRGKVTWIADVRNPKSGERIRLDAATKRAAQKRRDEKLQEWREEGILVGDPDTTLDEYGTAWLARLPVQGLKPKTITSYQQLFHKHISPILGATKIRELRRGQVKALLTEKYEATFQVQQKIRDEAGNVVKISVERSLSRNTVRLIRACLSAMLGEAVDDELIKENPASGQSRRRGQKAVGTVSAAERQKAIRPFTESELDAILESTESDRDYGPLFLLLARTGMRPGEALALKWSDFNFTNRKILVERALSAGCLGTTKTEGIRTVDMSRGLATALTVLYKLREVQTLKAKWGDVPDWVFVNTVGKHLDERRVRRRFTRAMRKANVSGHRLYDLRHTFATLLLAKGAPITYVAAQLGHARPSTTLQFYAHWLPRADTGFVDDLDAPAADRHRIGTISEVVEQSDDGDDEKAA
jgi:integrase